MKHAVIVILAGAAALSLAACNSPANSRKYYTDSAAYWQRASTAGVVHMDGPKAQQTLQRDIARCYTEVKELETLGTLRNALPPANTRYRNPQSQEQQLSQWERDPSQKYALAEKGTFQNFNGCMVEKGWERVEYLPYDISKKDRGEYTDSIKTQRYRTRMGEREWQTDAAPATGVNN